MKYKISEFFTSKDKKYAVGVEFTIPEFEYVDTEIIDCEYDGSDVSLHVFKRVSDGTYWGIEELTERVACYSSLAEEYSYNKNAEVELVPVYLKTIKVWRKIK